MSENTIQPVMLADALAIDGGTPVRTRPLPPESPGIHWFDEEEIAQVAQVIQARSPFRFYGPDVQHMCDKLEARFRELYGVDHTLAVSSGTEAIYISLAAMDVGPGDEVLIPGYLWTSCINGIVRLGAIPRLVDIDDSFDMSPADLERKIGPHTKAVLYVHMSGAAGDVRTIVDIARRHNLMVLEDCAQANGATLNGQPVGSFGDIGILSFQLNKSITAGEGGMIVCGDDHLYRRCFGIHDLGYARDNVGILMDTSCDEQYHLWGTGARMSELAGAFLLAQVDKLQQINTTMREAKWRIRRELEKIDGLEFRRIADPDGGHGRLPDLPAQGRRSRPAVHQRAARRGDPRRGLRQAVHLDAGMGAALVLQQQEPGEPPQPALERLALDVPAERVRRGLQLRQRRAADLRRLRRPGRDAQGRLVPDGN